MKPEIKTKWLSALRSGEYQQGLNYLLQDGQYCCLGVLCDLYGKETGAEWEETPNVHEGILSMRGSATTLPRPVQEWAGIEGANPEDLAALNDVGSTFEELAKIIEEAL